MLLMNREVYADCRTSIKVVCLCLISLPIFFGVSCSEKDEHPAENYDSAETPVFELKTTTDMGFISSSNNMLAGAGQDGSLYLWDWGNMNKEAQETEIDAWVHPRLTRTPPLPQNQVCTVTSQGHVIHASHKTHDNFIVIRNIEGDHQFNQWALGKEWYCMRLQNTRNGKFIGLTSSNFWDFIYGDTKLPTAHRFGVISPQASAINWVTSVYQHDFLPKVSAISVSEDGKYLAAVGTSDGGFIHVAGVEGRKVLWQKVPHGDEVPHGIWTVNFNDVCFSPDSTHIYVAGNLGLFCFDVVTGEILSQWQIEGRFVSVDVSPDGRLVAGGTEISGFVHIYNVKTGKMLLKLLTGQFSIYGLAFSPDSTLLATSGVMNTNVKIWKMPSVDSETVEVKEPNESKR